MRVLDQMTFLYQLFTTIVRSRVSAAGKSRIGEFASLGGESTSVDARPRLCACDHDGARPAGACARGWLASTGPPGYRRGGDACPTCPSRQRPTAEAVLADTRLVVGRGARPAGGDARVAVVVAAADNTAPVYAAAAGSSRASRQPADVRRVDVQLGAEGRGYLSPTTTSARGDLRPARGAPGELVPPSALGRRADVAVKPVTARRWTGQLGARPGGRLGRRRVGQPARRRRHPRPRRYGRPQHGWRRDGGPGPRSQRRARGLNGADRGAGDGARRRRPGPLGGDRPGGTADPGARPRLPAWQGIVSRTGPHGGHRPWEASWSPSSNAAPTSTSPAAARTCADLLAAAAAGLAAVAMVSADLRSLDRAALAPPARPGVAVVGVYPPGDEAAERHLRQLGIDAVVAADADGTLLQAAVDALAPAGADDRSATPAPTRSRSLLTAPPRGPPTGRTRACADGGDAGATRRRRAPRSRSGGRPAPPGGPPSRSTSPPSWPAPGPAPCSSTPTPTAAASPRSLGLLDEAPGLAAAARAADHGSLDLPGLARLAPEVRAGPAGADRHPQGRALARAAAAGARARPDAGARSWRASIVVDCGFSLEDDEELSYDTRAPRRNAATLTALAQADRVVAVGAADPVGPAAAGARAAGARRHALRRPGRRGQQGPGLRGGQPGPSSASARPSPASPACRTAVRAGRPRGARRRRARRPVRWPSRRRRRPPARDRRDRRRLRWRRDAWRPDAAAGGGGDDAGPDRGLGRGAHATAARRDRGVAHGHRRRPRPLRRRAAPLGRAARR